MNIIEYYTDFDYKKTKYFKDCLRIGMEVGSAVDRRNSEDMLEYINELESTVLKLNAKVKALEKVNEDLKSAIHNNTNHAIESLDKYGR